MAYSFDDGWDNGPEVIQAGTAAFGLYCRAGAWVARNLTDGFVPAAIAASYGTPEWTRKLLDAGLWETCEGGYRMPHYLDRNPSAEKVRARRQADAERKAKWRESRERKEEMSRRDSDRSHNGSPARSPRSPAPPPKGGGGGAHAKRGARAPTATDRPLMSVVDGASTRPPKCDIHLLELPCRSCASERKTATCDLHPLPLPCTQCAATEQAESG